MGCSDEKLSKHLTQTFMVHCNAMLCQQVTLSGDAEWPKVADAVSETLARLVELSGVPYRAGLVVELQDCARRGDLHTRSDRDACGSVHGLNWWQVLATSVSHG